MCVCIYIYIYIYKLLLNNNCGVIESSDIHPPFVLGLKPIPRPIVAYEEDSDDHGNLVSHAEDNPVLG